jgi:hypothetical protein
MAADATVHLPGCGTGLEARLLGCPTLCLDTVPDLKYPRLGISSRISPLVADVAALVVAVGEAIANPAKYSVMSAEQETLLQHRVMRSDDLVCARIVRHLAELHMRSLASEAPPALAGMGEVLRAAQAEAALKAFHHIRSAQHKRLQVTADTVRGTLDRLSACIGLSNAYSVDSPADGIFVIGPS